MSPYVVPDSRVFKRNLPTPLTPTFWGELAIVSFDALDSPQPGVIPENHGPAPLSAPPKEPGNASTLPSKTADPPGVPHNRLFFDDGNVTFLVQGVLYRLHRFLFCRESNELKDRLSHLSAQQESSLPPTVPLHDVKSVDFDAFLSILYPPSYNTLEERSFEEWISILDLSTRWGFTSIRDLAIRCIKPPNPLGRLLLAREHAVEQWIVPALLELCERPEQLSLEEARLMDFEDVVLVMSVRQAVRSPTLAVGGTGIRNCIRAWKSGEPWSSVSDPDNLRGLQGDTPSLTVESIHVNPQPTSAFGQRTSFFGINPQPTSAFGSSPQSTSIFGINPKPTSIFGINSQPTSSFGVNSQPTSSFGINSQPTSSFGVNSQPTSPTSSFGINSQPTSSFGINPQPTSAIGADTPQKKGEKGKRCK